MANLSQYPEISISNKNFAILLKDKICKKEPFCVIRFGDSFTVPFRNIINCHGERVSKSLGFENVNEFLNSIREIFTHSIKKSNVIGLLTQSIQNNLNNKQDWYKPEEWLFSIDEFNKMGIDINSKQIVDHQVFYTKEVGSIHGFKNIIDKEDIHIISSNADNLKKNNIDKLLGVNVSYTLTPLSLKKSGKVDLIEKISKIKEFIVLYGVGTFGKDLGIHLKNAGKIALDFGSALDAWAGIKSRNWFTQDNCMIYKGTCQYRTPSMFQE